MQGLLVLGNPSEKGKVMEKITRTGVDLAKNTIQAHGVDCMERVVIRKAISRQKFPEWFANLGACLVAMEACSVARCWARKLRALGQEVRLIAPQFAVPYRKGGKHVKNDRLDAEAIGIGPLTASAAVATVGDARVFKNGRQFAAWLGSTQAGEQRRQ
jgi:transposase